MPAERGGWEKMDGWMDGFIAIIIIVISIQTPHAFRQAGLCSSGHGALQIEPWRLQNRALEALKSASGGALGGFSGAPKPMVAKRGPRRGKKRPQPNLPHLFWCCVWVLGKQGINNRLGNL